MPDAESVTLPAETNQALGLGRFAIDFMRGGSGRGGEPDRAVIERTVLFHTDAMLCGLSALALQTNAPTVLRREALQYALPPGDPGPPLGSCVRHGATVLGSAARVKSEKAILANVSAVREWDSNGTNFGYNPARGHVTGEFGHNDYYPVCIAAAQMAGGDGAFAVRGMVLLDEIRGRLAEVFSLKTYRIDHVLHGAIASAAAFGAMVGATAEQIESAVGMLVAHHVPFRALRAGKQLSDSKGASAAISTEAAIVCLKRSMAGFQGPRDIFRNPEAVFRLFEGPGETFHRAGSARQPSPPRDASPFDLVLSRAGRDFAIMGMHFKIGLYEHQSAGAIEGLISILRREPLLLDDPSGGAIRSIRVVAYEPAFSIIGDPAKRDPRTRQSADHSMAYIVATLLRKALEARREGREAGWGTLMLGPRDYAPAAILDPRTRAIMARVEFVHGGAEYDRRYPDGIPTSVDLVDARGRKHDSGLVMYPPGHARNTEADLPGLLRAKFRMLGELASDQPAALIARLERLASMSADDIDRLHDDPIAQRERLE